MSATVYEPVPRYVVETACTITNVTGKRATGAWNFHRAFHDLTDATSAADRLAEGNEYVRVIDRTKNEEN